MSNNEKLTIVSKQNLHEFSEYIKRYVDKTKESVEEGITSMLEADIDSAWGDEADGTISYPTTFSNLPPECAGIMTNFYNIFSGYAYLPYMDDLTEADFTTADTCIRIYDFGTEDDLSDYDWNNGDYLYYGYTSPIYPCYSTYDDDSTYWPAMNFSVIPYNGVIGYFDACDDYPEFSYLVEGSNRPQESHFYGVLLDLSMVPQETKSKWVDEFLEYLEYIENEYDLRKNPVNPDIQEIGEMLKKSNIWSKWDIPLPLVGDVTICLEKTDDLDYDYYEHIDYTKLGWWYDAGSGIVPYKPKS